MALTPGRSTDTETSSLANFIALRNGWFAPTSEILDYLRQQPGFEADLSFRETVRLEILFQWDYLRRDPIHPKA